MKRYEALADHIAQLIRDGVLAPGAKAPSVRRASSTYGVSPATVFQAYYLLEDRGLLQARARSGYFVQARATDVLAEPEISAHPACTTEVDVSELVFSVLESIQDPGTVPFGSAFPCTSHFPLARLARSMSSALKQLSPEAITSDMTAGNPDLRRQIALRYMLAGVKLPLPELVITNGAMEALNLCLQAVTRPGDTVAIESPAFYASLQVLERLKLKAVEIPVHPREGMDLAVLEERLREQPIKACWLMSHLQNPLGASLSDDKKRRLCALAKAYDLPIIEDDVYSELYYGAHAPKPIKYFDQEGLVLNCGSFSKSLAPGYRVGWVAAGRFAQKVNRIKLMTTISPSVPAQVALADYLQHGGYDRHLRKLRHTLERQQGAMLASAARHFPIGTKVTRPLGGYFLWFEFPENVDALELFQMAQAQGISIAPGPIFSATKGFRHCARLNYGHPFDANAERAMALLGRMLASFS